MSMVRKYAVAGLVVAAGSVLFASQNVEASSTISLKVNDKNYTVSSYYPHGLGGAIFGATNIDQLPSDKVYVGLKNQPSGRQVVTPKWQKYATRLDENGHRVYEEKGQFKLSGKNIVAYRYYTYAPKQSKDVSFIKTSSKNQMRLEVHPMTATPESIKKISARYSSFNAVLPVVDPYQNISKVVTINNAYATRRDYYFLPGDFTTVNTTLKAYTNHKYYATLNNRYAGYTYDQGSYFVPVKGGWQKQTFYFVMKDGRGVLVPAKYVKTSTSKANGITLLNSFISKDTTAKQMAIAKPLIASAKTAKTSNEAYSFANQVTSALLNLTNNGANTNVVYDNNSNLVKAAKRLGATKFLTANTNQKKHIDAAAKMNNDLMNYLSKKDFSKVNIASSSAKRASSSTASVKVTTSVTSPKSVSASSVKPVSSASESTSTSTVSSAKSSSSSSSMKADQSGTAMTSAQFSEAMQGAWYATKLSDTGRVINSSKLTISGNQIVVTPVVVVYRTEAWQGVVSNSSWQATNDGWWSQNTDTYYKLSADGEEMYSRDQSNYVTTYTRETPNLNNLDENSVVVK